MGIKLNTALGGSITLEPTNTANNVTVNLPVIDNGSIVTANASGNVGIGNASPPNTLTVGNGTADTRGTFRPTSAFAIGVANGAAFAGWIGGSGVTDTMVFTNSGGGERMRIAADGKVGIGNTAPPQKLTVWGSGTLPSEIANCQLLVGDTSGFANAGLALVTSASNASSITFGSTASPTVGRIEYDNTGNFMRFLTNGTNERVRIDSAGKLFVGTTSIVGNNRLVVAGSLGASTDNSACSIRLVNIDGPNYASINAGVVGQTNNGMQFSTDGVSRMVIDASGNFLIGATGASIVAKLGVYSTGGIAAFLTATTNPDIIRIDVNTSGSTGNTYVMPLRSAGNLVGGVFINGTTSTSFNTSSDYRLKENVAPMTGALATVAALKPVTYTWKTDGSSGQGFIAHELQEVVPDCVTGDKDAVNEDGSIKPQGVDTSFLVATLTAAIQELNAKVDAQAARIEALENK